MKPGTPNLPDADHAAIQLQKTLDRLIPDVVSAMTCASMLGDGGVNSALAGTLATFKRLFRDNKARSEAAYARKFGPQKEEAK